MAHLIFAEVGITFIMIYMIENLSIQDLNLNFYYYLTIGIKFNIYRKHKITKLHPYSYIKF